MNDSPVSHGSEPSALSTAMQQRIEDFCRELALELRRITGRTQHADALDLPKPVTGQTKEEKTL